MLLFLTNYALFAQEFNQLDKFFNTLFENDKIMGSVAILKEGDLIYSKSVGYQFTNAAKNKPLSSQSKYRIGSITKTFTAVMVFQLIDEGKLQLDDKLLKFFPKVKNASKIEIRHLLNHSSGLYNITNEDDFSQWMLEPSTREQMLNRVYKHEVDFQPGERHEYSNTNFTLLGYILEQLEDDSYAEILTKRIAKPLKLSNTYSGGMIDVEHNECLSYTILDDGALEVAKQTNMSNPGGAGAIVSNPTDLVIFMNALFNGKLMTAHSFEAMTTISGGEYGSGILKGDKNGLTLFAHNGSIDRFNAMLLYIPEIKTAIALNTNALNFSMMPIMFNVIAAVTGEQVSIPSFETIALSPQNLKHYVGIYECEDLPFSLEFESDGKVLKGAPQGNDLKILSATKKDEFTLDTMGIVLKFNTSAQSLLLEQAGESPKKCLKNTK